MTEFLAAERTSVVTDNEVEVRSKGNIAVLVAHEID